MGIQKTIKAMECTVEDTAIEAEGSGFEADDVICKDGQYDVYLDKEYNVVKKVKEDQSSRLIETNPVPVRCACRDFFVDNQGG